MTEGELMALCSAGLSGPGLPCLMADKAVALLIRIPAAETPPPRSFGFQVPGEAGIRWRRPEDIEHLGGGALREVPA